MSLRFLVSIVCCVICSGAWALDLNEQKQFDIPAQKLTTALVEFSRQAGAPIVSATPEVDRFNSPGVTGRMSLKDALKALLHGTGLEIKTTDNGAIAVGAFGANSSQGTDNPPSSSSAFPDPESSRITEIIVTAQKKSERLQDVPVPVTVLDADQLAGNGQVLLRDYYSTVPGLTVTPNLESAQIIAIRGVTTGDYTNPTVGILVDDLPYCCSTQAGVVVPDLDPGDLERIEVLRGPQGTLYGASGMGGLIKYVTKDPSTAGFSGRVEAGTEYVRNGAEPGFDVRASANVPLTNTWAFRISAYNRQDAGYIDNPGLCGTVQCAGRDGVNEAQANGGRLAMLWRPSEDFSLKLGALYQNTRGSGLPESVMQPGLGDLQQNYIPGAGEYDREVQVYNATINFKLNHVDIISLTGYNVNSNRDSWDSTGLYGTTVQPVFAVSGVLFRDITRTMKLSQELRLSGSEGGRFDWLVGGFFTHEHGVGSQILEAEDPSAGQIPALYSGVAYDSLEPVAYREYAGFADFTWHFNERLSVQFGARESHIEVKNDVAATTGAIFGLTPGVISLTPGAESKANAFTYLLTPQYRWSPDLMLYARLASGFRPGGPNAAISIQNGGTAAYDPDKTTDYEIGLKGDFLDRRLSVDASLYYIDWKNIQISLNHAGFGYISNGSGAKSEGAELSATAHPATGLVVSGWVAYGDAELTQAFPSSSPSYGVAGDRLPNATRFSGNLSVEQEFPLWAEARGYVGGNVSYVGNRIGMFQGFSDPEQTLPLPRLIYPSYTKTDLRAGVRVNSWTANVFINNVADVRGLLNRVDFFPNEYVYIQPRTIGVSFSRAY